MTKPVKIGIAAALLVLSLVLPYLFSSMLIRHFIVLIAINIVLVMGLDIVVGHLGLISLGHAGFMGIGAYACAISVMNHNAPFLLGLVLAVLCAGLMGFIVGYPSINLRGHYFVIVTFISGIIFNLFFTNLIGITKGPMGIPGIPPPSIGFGERFSIVVDSKVAYYYLVWVFIVIVGFVKIRFYHSKMGRALSAIREDQDLARSIGVRVHFYKVLGFVLSTAIAGLSGGLYAHYFRFIGPDSFTLFQSFNAFVMNLVGGMGTVAGPIIGPALLTLIDEVFQLFKPEYARILFGVFLILIILYMPKGIAGLVKERMGSRAWPKKKAVS